MSFNPFNHIVKTKYSKILVTSFLEKLKDTFEVFCGNFGDSKEHAGIFDYVTLMIPTALDRLLQWLVKPREDDSGKINLMNVPLEGIFWGPLAIISLALIVPRVLFAALFTLAVSPLVAIVHGIAKIKASRRAAEYSSLPVKIYSSLPKEISITSLDGIQNTTSTLGEYLKGKTEDVKASQLLYDEQNHEGLDLLLHPKCSETLKFVDAPTQTASVEMEFPKDEKALKAMLDLNVGDITTYSINFGLFGKPKSDLRRSYDTSTPEP